MVSAACDETKVICIAAKHHHVQMSPHYETEPDRRRTHRAGHFSPNSGLRPKSARSPEN